MEIVLSRIYEPICDDASYLNLFMHKIPLSYQFQSDEGQITGNRNSSRHGVTNSLTIPK